MKDGMEDEPDGCTVVDNDGSATQHSQILLSQYDEEEREGMVMTFYTAEEAANYAGCPVKDLVVGAL